MAHKIIHGDSLYTLRALPDNSIHCVITSPPYYSLRDYGLPPTDWPEMEISFMPGMPPVTIPAESCCLGLESDLNAYVAHLVLILRECRRVLREDGQLWLNLGDSYGSGNSGLLRRDNVGGIWKEESSYDQSSSKAARARKPVQGMKGQLLMVPSRVALALQADGWVLRQGIVWEKPNALPESVKNRCTNSYEMLWLCTKKPAGYFFDYEAIKESSVNPDDLAYRNKIRQGKKYQVQNPNYAQNFAMSFEDTAKRRKRNVWKVATRSFQGAHFAVYPPGLVEPCILAGTSAHGVCPECGAPFHRITEKGAPIESWQAASGADRSGEYHGEAQKDYAGQGVQNPSEVKARILAGMVEIKTVGWRPSCDCAGLPADASLADYAALPVAPAVVLDPFNGSGTTLAVASGLGRFGLGIDLNPAYVEISEKRLGDGVQAAS